MGWYCFLRLYTLEWLETLAVMTIYGGFALRIFYAGVGLPGITDFTLSIDIYRRILIWVA